jgi:hypothetical protein
MAARPAALKACFGNSIRFAGIEAEGEQWNARVWTCELSGSEPAGA